MLVGLSDLFLAESTRKVLLGLLCLGHVRPVSDP